MSTKSTNGKNIIMDPFSKQHEVIDIKFTSPEFVIIIFEGENEYRKAANPNDTLSGMITNMFLESENCLIRDTLFLIKRRNPLAMYFIMRKK